ncbi:hypothetical protein QFC24_002233 [Naganishia onofrii]|uniref:Uncharacterized protein n=1 Tax=Naganishia onofrii TaxID=1851511 RepID=A0ACC2XR17_9TREE|nr:hypothetical protein QFC24_002233 [Naganishia onofrii]
MNTTDWTATTLSPQARTATHTMSPPLSAEANGKGADVNGMQESPLKNAQVPLKRKEMDQGSVDPSSTSSTTAGSSSASSKRPKTMKPSSSDGSETLISGTFVRGKLIDHIGSALEPVEITDGGPASKQ